MYGLYELFLLRNSVAILRCIPRNLFPFPNLRNDQKTALLNIRGFRIGRYFYIFIFV